MSIEQAPQGEGLAEAPQPQQGKASGEPETLAENDLIQDQPDSDPVQFATTQEAFNGINDGLALFRALNQQAPTRELAIAITHIETGMLWIIHDDRQREQALAARHALTHPEAVGLPN